MRAALVREADQPTPNTNGQSNWSGREQEDGCSGRKERIRSYLSRVDHRTMLRAMLPPHGSPPNLWGSCPTLGRLQQDAEKQRLVASAW